MKTDTLRTNTVDSLYVSPTTKNKLYSEDETVCVSFRTRFRDGTGPWTYDVLDYTPECGGFWIRDREYWSIDENSEFPDLEEAVEHAQAYVLR